MPEKGKDKKKKKKKENSGIFSVFGAFDKLKARKKRLQEQERKAMGNSKKR